jgi:hypothetical protein
MSKITVGWEGQAQMTKTEILATAGASAESYLQLIKDKGIPIGPAWLVEMELRKDGDDSVYYYRWMRKDKL